MDFAFSQCGYSRRARNSSGLFVSFNFVKLQNVNLQTISKYIFNYKIYFKEKQKTIFSF